MQLFHYTSPSLYLLTTLSQIALVSTLAPILDASKNDPLSFLKNPTNQY